MCNAPATAPAPDPAPGYPACPDHTEKGPLFELLKAERWPAPNLGYEPGKL
jgi:hypothetical protein